MSANAVLRMCSFTKAIRCVFLFFLQFEVCISGFSKLSLYPLNIYDS